jgi:hypothetical protein
VGRYFVGAIPGYHARFYYHGGLHIINRYGATSISALMQGVDIASANITTKLGLLWDDWFDDASTFPDYSYSGIEFANESLLLIGQFRRDTRFSNDPEGLGWSVDRTYGTAYPAIFKGALLYGEVGSSTIVQYGADHTSQLFLVEHADSAFGDVARSKNIAMIQPNFYMSATQMLGVIVYTNLKRGLSQYATGETSVTLGEGYNLDEFGLTSASGRFQQIVYTFVSTSTQDLKAEYYGTMVFYETGDVI